METIFGHFDANMEVVEDIKLDISKLPSSDPMAFGYGIHSGQRNLKNPPRNGKINHGSNWSELSAEYIRGFLLGYKGILVKEGTKFKKGQEQTYWFLGKPEEIKMNN